MRAILDRDIILAFSTLSAGTEVGNPPPGVGLERLRWDGANIVDLFTLSSIWVEPLNGHFILHAVTVPGAYQVAMTYNQRDLLILDNGVPRLSTTQEIEDKTRQDALLSLDADLARLRQASIGNQDVFLIVIVGLLSALTIAYRTNNATLLARIDALIPKLQSLPLSRMAELAPSAFAAFKTIMDNYFTRKDSI
jgi:hypothetical protein